MFAFYNEITDYTVVGLKDEEGIVELFIYDLDSGKYNKYQELNDALEKLKINDASLEYEPEVSQA